MSKIYKTETEWKEELSDIAFDVTRKGATEMAFSNDSFPETPAYFRCVCCKEILFDSAHKFESGSGWPSFFKPEDDERIEYIEDKTFGMVRVEVNCKRCGSHLGHVFDDGPAPSKLRYCINSLSLKLDKSN